jgi:hypothetical protein
MSITGRQQIMLAYSALRDFFQVRISDRALENYADDLEDIDADTVVAALRQLRREPGRSKIPLPSEVRALTSDDTETIDDKAVALAGRVMQSIGKFGYMKGPEAHAWLGDAGWQIVIAKGGWYNLCANTMSGENAFFAQCRELAKGIIRKEWRMELDGDNATRALHDDAAKLLAEPDKKLTR